MLEAKSLGQSHRVIIGPYHYGCIIGLAKFNNHLHSLAILSLDGVLLSTVGRFLLGVLGDEMLIVEKFLIELGAVKSGSVGVVG
jgi:hypothetical protein